MRFYFRIGLICCLLLGCLLLFWMLLPTHKPDIPKQVVHKHKLAVLIPFRDRFDELLSFLPHMHNFLRDQSIDHSFYILNQVDAYRFNRGALVNVGVLETEIFEADYLAIHDVDLLPLNPSLSYAYPDSGPVHLSAPNLHPMYHYPTYMGGILLIRRDHFRTVNGMSNIFWGWGREDDEFRLRLIEKYETIKQPNDIATGNKTFLHLHSSRRVRDSRLYFNQRSMTYKRDFATGINTVMYTIKGKHKIKVESVNATVLDINLFCDLFSTPYCSPPVL